MLLNTVYTILTTAIGEKLKKYTEVQIKEYQLGFRKDKTTTNVIHIPTQVIEKCYEHGIETHMLFINFEQAFDSVIRTSLLQDLKRIGVPTKLINLIKMAMRDSTAGVITSEDMTEGEIEIENGVRQGDALSATLLNVMLEEIVREAGYEKTDIE